MSMWKLLAPSLLLLALSASLPAQTSTPFRSGYRDTHDSWFRPISGRLPGWAKPLAGAAGAPLVRWTPPAYPDGVGAMGGADRPSARVVSQIVNHESREIPNSAGASAFLWQWGQFLDHDLALTESGREPAPIVVPPDDPHLAVDIPFLRSFYRPGTGHRRASPREQVNVVTAYVDGSQVYGSDLIRARALRALDGTGRLKTSAGDLLPYNLTGLANAGGDAPDLFLAGDIRVNEQLGLTAMHVLFVREHNRWAGILRAQNPAWSDERIYQQARALVGAELQAISYREFLPLLLGDGAIPPYAGYQSEAEPGIANVFATVAFRFGHSALNPRLLRLGPDQRPTPEGPLDLAQAFFRPLLLTRPGAVEEILRGLAAQQARAVDPFVTDAVRNLLMGGPDVRGLDLAALNIQRGRDHGIPDYNSCRAALGLPRKTSFASISSNPEVQDRLERAYGTIDAIDAWVGGLAEDPVHGGLVGELFSLVLRKQFVNVRDADPFWYERVFDGPTRQLIESLTLSRIIQLNTEIGDEMPSDVFRAP